MDDTKPLDLSGLLGPTLPGASPSPASALEKPGDQIGPYRLLQFIGGGGFGDVYLAERREPFVQRVALKVIKPGMDTKQVIARFEQERQALAVMDHPNVAKVFDAGVTPAGRPYFVMEHVAGEAITEYCDRHNLSVRQRLELFIPVCEAVQHAHHKGLIHRDIKPSNVLVAVRGGDGGPVVKVIDFGVAKAVSHALTDKTVFTEMGQLIGTPEYMSPEQAEMGATDIDTRTDVYSLGVLLYELLSGSLPFARAALRAAGYGEIQRIIREVDPPKPSTRLTTIGAESLAIARHRGAKVEELAAELRRELDWIPMKALRKDRTQRYGTPGDLAKDVRRYLDGEALEAGPEGAGYRVRKFVRRHRGPVVAAGAVLVAVLAGVGTTSYFAVVASKEAASRRIASLAVQRQAVLNARQRGSWAEMLELIRATEEQNAVTPELELLRIEALDGLGQTGDAITRTRTMMGRDDLGDAAALTKLWLGDLLLLGITDEGTSQEAVALIQDALAGNLPPSQHAYAQGLIGSDLRAAMGSFELALELDADHYRARRMVMVLSFLRGDSAACQHHAEVLGAVLKDDLGSIIFQVLSAIALGNDNEAVRLLTAIQPKLAEAEYAELAETVELYRQCQDEASDFLNADQLTLMRMSRKVIGIGNALEQLQRAGGGVRQLPILSWRTNGFMEKFVEFTLLTASGPLSDAQLASFLIPVGPIVEPYFLLMQGQKLVDAGRYDDAIAVYDGLLKKTPVLNMRQSTLELRSLAVASRMVAVKRDPDRQLELPAAQAALRQAIRDATSGKLPHSYQWRSYAGWLADYLDDPDMARLLLGTLIETNPDDYSAIVKLVEIEARLSSLERIRTLRNRLPVGSADRDKVDELLKQTEDRVRSQLSPLGDAAAQP